MMHQLTMPFIATQSHGGPYDDAAFCAGWEMGALHAQLRAMSGPAAVGLVTVNFGAVIRRANCPQADLIAMDCGAVLYINEWPDVVPEPARTEWACIRFCWNRMDQP